VRQLYVNTMYLLFIAWIIFIFYLCMKLLYTISKGYARIFFIIFRPFSNFVTNSCRLENRSINQEKQPIYWWKPVSGSMFSKTKIWSVVSWFSNFPGF
jgi:hypothetical protein